MAALSALFVALAAICDLDAAFVAVIAVGRGLSGPDATCATAFCAAILACGVICLVAARFAV